MVLKDKFDWHLLTERRKKKNGEEIENISWCQTFSWSGNKKKKKKRKKRRQIWEEEK